MTDNIRKILNTLLTRIIAYENEAIDKRIKVAEGKAGAELATADYYSGMIAACRMSEHLILGMKRRELKNKFDETK